MEHGPPLAVALILSGALAAGALMRALGRRVPVPYTVTMMLLGIGTGIAVRRYAAHLEEAPTEVFGGVSHFLSSDLIIFVFLPALVFESALSIDVHAFRRDLAPVTMLAVPVMVAATTLTALFVWQITGWTWGWSFGAALVFGALISATDPVAVVAVLRDLGAPKRLGLLIEGESLLNDGTAIVAFTVLLSILIGETTSFNVGAVSLEFLKVVAGGVAVGLALGWIVSFWLGRTFNDPLVEITLTLVLAYAAMGIAEGLLHVSGVMALVTAGLFMAGPGRTQVSPEVRSSLHHFWETLAYLANTIIFFLVGVVIAVHLEGAAATDLVVVIACFAGLVVIRFALFFAVRPLLSKMAEPVSPQMATVMSWGGLRGAVSLALALVVEQHPAVDEVLGNQILRVTAGVVLLTIALNGSTTGWLLSRLGFGKKSAAERLAAVRSEHQVVDEVLHRVRAAAHTPELRTVRFDSVQKTLWERAEALTEKADVLREALAKEEPQERAATLWRRALSIEQRTYWEAFANGTLGRAALTTLTAEIDRQRDRIQAFDFKAPENRVPPPSGLRGQLRRLERRMGRTFGARDLSTLTLRYDLLRAVAASADSVLEELSASALDEGVVDQIRVAYRRYGERAKERLEDLRVNLPEVTSAIEDKLARRVALNLEREGFHTLASRGVISPEQNDEARRRVEAAMKRLQGERPRATLPETTTVCRATPLFRGLPGSTLEQLTVMTVEQVVLAGETLFERGDVGDALYIIVRGAVEVLDADGETPIATLRTGDVLGEMALLGFTTRTATARALTSVTVGRIDRTAFAELDEIAVERIRGAFELHWLDNALRSEPDFADLPSSARRAWAKTAESRAIAAGQPLTLAPGQWAFVCAGELAEAHAGGLIRGPGEWPIEVRSHVLLLDDSRLSETTVHDQRRSRD